MHHRPHRGFIVFLTLLLVAFVLVGFLYYVRSDISATDIPEVIRDTHTLTPTEIVPDVPLRGPTVPTETHSTLSVAGVLAWTNKHRAEAGLPPLKLNNTLSASAAIKVNDMFSAQYFAHESPNGNSVGDLADLVGYAYILIGENLALGNYKDDQELVQAWMDSPGHRENILNDRYTDIGIAVREGIFEGDRVWLAVQHFGFPRSVCPEPSAALNDRITHNQELLTDLDVELTMRQEELENTRPRYGHAYNERVKAYNELVATYNALVKETKALVEEYNEQVQIFNACASS